MKPELAINARFAPDAGRTHEITLDLAALAGVGREDRVRVQGLRNRTMEIFERTLELIGQDAPEETARSRTEGQGAGAAAVRFIPQEKDLRARFVFAEALGSYATLNSLLDRYAPAYQLTRAIDEPSLVEAISEREVEMLEEYRDQIEAALMHATEHLGAHAARGFSDEELQELNDILREARDRYRAIETVLGMRLIHEVEQSVHELYRLHEKTQTVQRTITGIFMIDSEIMFMPTADLVRIVENIFKAIGNPFVVENIDGTMLLAARNLLIQVVSFYSYYGREQIYRVFEKNQSKAGRAQIATCIRNEIKMLFSACRVNNKLVLTRLMENAEREFELSVESVQIEATNRAIVAVERLMPVQAQMPKPKPKSLLRKLTTWLFRETA